MKGTRFSDEQFTGIFPSIRSARNVATFAVSIF